MRGEKTSKYNGVCFRAGKSTNCKRWSLCITIEGYTYSKTYTTEREAAKAADIIYIKYGKYDKLNILKPCSK
jgi:hypothetical protein